MPFVIIGGCVAMFTPWFKCGCIIAIVGILTAEMTGSGGDHDQ